MPLLPLQVSEALKIILNLLFVLVWVVLLVTVGVRDRVVIMPVTNVLVVAVLQT